MINREELENIVRKRIPGEINVDEHISIHAIDDETRLLDDLNFDSLLFIQLIVDIEEEFNIEINEIEFDTMNKFGDLFKTVREAENA